MRKARIVTALLFGLLLPGSTAARPAAARLAEIWPTAGWTSATPESQGIDSNALAHAIDTLRARRLPVHSLFVERNGYVVLDAYFFPYQRDEMHDMASVTKSVISTLVGVAERHGALSNLDEPVASILPGENFRSDPRKGRIALAQLLSMTSGLDCSVPPGVNLLRQMEQSSDWMTFTWNLPQSWEAGSSFDYCGGGMHIVSAAITAATRQSAFDLARRELFAPLGITRATWATDNRGNSRGFADLQLSPPDAAKLGYLWLHQGRWQSQQIVPSAYLAAALSRHATVQPGIQYGYGFWLYPSHVPFDFEANGRGGQRITVIPGQNLVEVVTSGGADANVVAPLVAAAVHANTPLPADPAGNSRLAAAIVSAARPPAPTAMTAIPVWAYAISSLTYVVGANPFDLGTLRLTFSSPDRATVQLGFTNGTRGSYLIGLDGSPRLSWDTSSGHRVAMTGWWLNNGLALDYNTVARIDDYHLRITPVPDGLTIRVTERTGLVDAVLEAVPDGSTSVP